MMPSTASEPTSRTPTAYVVISFLVLSTAVAYWSVKDQGFSLYDDQTYVVNNYFLQPGITLENLVWAFTKSHASNWHPMSWISHMLDYQLFKLDPVGHHLHNVFLHLLNSILLYLIFRRMTGREGPSTFVALVFALHPVHVESVAWVSERKDVLSTLFGLLTIGAYGRYCASPGIGRYLAVILFFAFGLMAKPMLVTLPFLLLLLDYWPLKRFAWNQATNAEKYKFTYLLYEKIPLLLFSFGSSIITIIVQQQSGAMAQWKILPLGTRIANGAVSYLRYIKNTVLPTDLTVFYPHQGGAISTGLIFIAIVVLTAVTVWVLKRAKRSPYLSVGWFWFLGMLVPVLGIVQVGAQAMADRYMYFPMVGLAIMAAWFVADGIQRWGFQRYFVGGAAALSCLLCTILTVRQVNFWKNDRTLFERALQVTEQNWLAHYSLGVLSEQEGDDASAQNQYERAIAFYPRFAPGHFALGEILLKAGDFEGSIPHFQFALEKGEQVEKACMNLAVAFANTGKPNEALQQLVAVHSINPYFGEPHKNLGLILAGLGKYDDAEYYLTEAQKITPLDTLLTLDRNRVRRLRRNPQLLSE